MPNCRSLLTTLALKVRSAVEPATHVFDNLVVKDGGAYRAIVVRDAAGARLWSRDRNDLSAQVPNSSQPRPLRFLRKPWLTVRPSSGTVRA